MRLTSSQIQIIQSSIQAVLGNSARVWLYGSRLDDNRKGGDVDLLVESALKPSLLLRARIKLLIENALQLPVDVLLVQTNQPATPFETIARSQALALSVFQPEMQ